MARSHSTVLSINFLCALLCPVYGIDLGTNFFEQQQHPQVCQVYTLLESPVVIETFVPSNTILIHPACGCEITVTNAPTVLSTTVTVTETLGQNPISTSSRNPRYSVTSEPNNLEVPTFHIIISDTTNQRRQSSSVYYLKGDGSITTNSSEAVQIYESDGRLYTIKGAPEGTYFADVNVKSITFASQPHSSLTPSSIAGSFDLGSTLRWQYEIFDNSQAIFALTPEGIVKAIFNGKVPRGVKRIGLILKRAGNYRSPVSSLSGTSTTGERTLEAGSTTSRKVPTTRRGPLNGVPSARPTHTYIQSSSPTGETASAIPQIANNLPALSNTKTGSSEKHSTTLHMKTTTKTSRPSSSTV